MSDIDPTELTVVSRRTTQEKFNQDLDVPPAAPAKGEREGLPAGYRMRADSHYVDQLVSRRPEKGDRGDSVRGGASTDSGDAAHEGEGRDRRSDKVLAQLQEEIATIASAAAMLANETSPLARRLSTDLIRAQTWRAAWLLRAQTLVDGRERSQLRPRPLSSILEQVRQGLAPECRLAGVTLHLHASDWNVMVSVDEAVIIAGITGAVFATLGVVGQADGVVIRISVDAAGTELRSIEVTQDDVTVSPTAGLRFFDLSWTDRPGGWAAGLAALTTRAAAQQHGGSAVMLLGERRGSTVRLNMVRTH